MTDDYAGLDDADEFDEDVSIWGGRLCRWEEYPQNSGRREPIDVATGLPLSQLLVEQPGLFDLIELSGKIDI